MNKTINLGAYGWHHKHWLNTFYPEELPTGGLTDKAEDWRLTYYSNVFNTVLVPGDYWKRDGQSGVVADCADWLDSVHEDFRFFVECHHRMFDNIALSALGDNLRQLQPQLSALVFLDQSQNDPLQTVADSNKPFLSLIESLEVDVFGLSVVADSPGEKIWRPDDHQVSRFAYIENDLSDLRSARRIAEDFMRQAECADPLDAEATLIVNHPQLKAADLSKFRALLELMDY